jgi:hypothetical protein
MAEAIEAKKADIEDCVVLKEGKTVILKIGGRDVPLKGFVQNFIKGTTMGMIQTLKEADIKEGDIIELKILVSTDDLR